MPQGQRPLRVCTYNIHKGFSTGNRRFVLPEMRTALRRADPDIIFLQEVIGEHRRFAKHTPDWPEESQYDYLAAELWPHVAYGRNRNHRVGHHGNAILSKFPIISWTNTDISVSRFENRGLLHAIIELPDKTRINCFNIHFGLHGRARRRQLFWLCEQVQQRATGLEPVLIAGDFNDWAGTASRYIRNQIQAMEIFEALAGRKARTFPSFFPFFKLDRIYCRGLLPKEASVLKGSDWAGLSDHRAICVEIDIY